MSSLPAGMCRFGMSPACWPSADIMPCFLLPGLKCLPAELNGGSHLPTAWTWNACSPAGRPLTASFTSTPAGDWMSSAVPTALPSASLRDALAVCAAAGAMAASAAMKLAAPRCDEKRDILVMRWASGCNGPPAVVASSHAIYMPAQHTGRPVSSHADRADTTPCGDGSLSPHGDLPARPTPVTVVNHTTPSTGQNSHTEGSGEKLGPEAGNAQP